MGTTNRETSSSPGGRGIEYLLRETSDIEQRLRSRLDNVRRDHDLDWRTLAASHREVADLSRMKVAPSPAEFWVHTAGPATSPLVEKACQVIDEEVEEFRRVVYRFGQAVADESRDPGYTPDASDHAFARAVQCLAGGGLDRTPLDRLGSRWQAKLRRSARAAAMPRSLLMPVRRADELVARIEMELLDQAPWAQDDRLLSAFELAHADVRSHLRERLRRTSVIVPRRSTGKLVAAR